MTTHYVLPDPIICKTIHFGGRLWECMVVNPQRCRFAISYGLKYYCRHPDGSTFDTTD